MRKAVRENEEAVEAIVEVQQNSRTRLIKEIGSCRSCKTSWEN